MRERSGEQHVEEVTDEPLYRDRVCGIDIGKAQMVATIRVPSDSNPARRESETRSFGTTKREVLALADLCVPRIASTALTSRVARPAVDP